MAFIASHLTKDEEKRDLDNSVDEVLDPTVELTLLKSDGTDDTCSVANSDDIPNGFRKVILLEEKSNTADTVIISPYTVPSGAYTIKLSNIISINCVAKFIYIL